MNFNPESTCCVMSVKCDVCKKLAASVFLTQIVDGKMQKVNMCESCSKEKGVSDPTGFALADLLLGMGAAQNVERSVPVGQRCPNCGFSQGEFKKTGRLGCSICYSTFHEGLEGMLKGMHKGLKHTGKIPARQVESREREELLRSLNSDLRKAIAREQYEEAAQLRDRIRLLGSGSAGASVRPNPSGGGETDN